MDIRKRAAALALTVLLAAGWPTALAAEAAAAPETAAESLPPEEDPELSQLMEEGELDDKLREYITLHGINTENFELAFCYTGTGETFFFNADKYINAASLYKLSLNMGLARKVAAGELSQEDQVAGMDISYIENRSLVYSDNAVSEALIGYFSPFRSYRLMQAEIAGIPESELPEDYFSSNNTSARFMMGVLKELWSNTDNYPNVRECMLEANPGEYFRRSLDGQYTVAQKYGGGDGYLHTAGIIYTPTPVLLVVMTLYVNNAERVIADMAQLAADYALELDARRDAILEARAEAERQAAEAAAKAEAERLAAEEAERVRLEAEEAARIEAERLASLTPEPVPTPAASQPQAPAQDDPEPVGAHRAVVIALSAVCIGLGVAYALGVGRRKKLRV